MGVAEKWRSGAASDRGLVRVENQDRSYVDDERGIFLVVDGLGGHAAGDRAAETAVEVIRHELASRNGDARRRVCDAITSANNRICELADEDESLRGMACVLTLAVLDGDRAVVGHVGDSRLYLIWNGAMRKLTSDHSPVGEREDRAELSEEEAMRHPRRHEVLRDVGSAPRSAGDPDFIETRQCRFKPDAAILLCSDGLTDLLTAAEISEIIERYDGDTERVARDLVEAANAAGGKDNITAIFVAGPEFLGSESKLMQEARERHGITRAWPPRPPQEATVGQVAGRLVYLVLGLVMGLLIGAALERWFQW